MISQALTLTSGASSGLRGGGVYDISSLRWANKISIRGTTALQITEKEAETKPELLVQCFKHSINRQIYEGHLRAQITLRARSNCVRKCLEQDRACTPCSSLIEKAFKVEASQATTWSQMEGEVSWGGISFPAGQHDFEKFSEINPHIRLSVYRAAQDKGDVYLIFRSKDNDHPRSQRHDVHIAAVTRLNSNIMEVIFFSFNKSLFHHHHRPQLETHFLPCTDLSAFCQAVYEYNMTDSANIKTQYASGWLPCIITSIHSLFRSWVRLLLAAF